ncbi:hypothetical protein GJAV_G00156920 [Gymnothorax javanicus]|nr:hypothetical protein GJAV_G00156920 [Gymnothorax javanicus]
MTLFNPTPLNKEQLKALLQQAPRITAASHCTERVFRRLGSEGKGYSPSILGSTIHSHLGSTRRREIDAVTYSMFSATRKKFVEGVDSDFPDDSMYYPQPSMFPHRSDKDMLASPSPSSSGQLSQLGASLYGPQSKYPSVYVLLCQTWSPCAAVGLWLRLTQSSLIVS